MLNGNICFGCTFECRYHAYFFLYLPESSHWLVIPWLVNQVQPWISFDPFTKPTRKLTKRCLISWLYPHPHGPSATFTLQDYDVVNASNEDPASPSMTSGDTSAFEKTPFVGGRGVVSILGHAPTYHALCHGCGMMALQQWLSGINLLDFASSWHAPKD